MLNKCYLLQDSYANNLILQKYWKKMLGLEGLLMVSLQILASGTREGIPGKYSILLTHLPKGETCL